MTLTYLFGDATDPIETDESPRVIAHVCNNVRAWGAGFTGALDKRWYHPRRDYFSQEQYKFPGKAFITEIRTHDNLYVANLIAQDGLRHKGNPTPLNYDWLCASLLSLSDQLITFETTPTIHMPKIGSGLAGGNWDHIVLYIQSLLCENFDVYVYLLE